MTTDDKRSDVQIWLNPLLADWIDDISPKWLSRTAMVNQLVFEALCQYEQAPEGLTRVPRMGGTATQKGNTSLRSALALEEINLPTKEQPRSAGRLPTPNIPEPKRGGAVPSNARAKQKSEYSESFDVFWKLYQSAPRKANGQKKPVAYQAWLEATNDTSTADLTRAINKAIAEQERLISADEFCAPLPDCFRWLRDGNYAVYLEEHKQIKVTPKPQDEGPVHPASRVFTAANGFDGPATGGVLKDLF